jgi:flagellar basal body rod protein FlgB
VVSLQNASTPRFTAIDVSFADDLPNTASWLNRMATLERSAVSPRGLDSELKANAIIGLNA